MSSACGATCDGLDTCGATCGAGACARLHGAGADWVAGGWACGAICVGAACVGGATCDAGVWP